MVGKHSSLKTLIKVLLREGVPRSSIFTTPLRQGLTHRWCLAWTFVPAAAEGYRQFAHEQTRKATLGAKVDNSSTALEDAGGEKEEYHYRCELTVQSLRETRIAADASALTTAAFSVLTPADRRLLAGEDAVTNAKARTDSKLSVPWLALERIAAAIEVTHHVQSSPPGEGETTQASVPPTEVGGTGNSTTACVYVPRAVHCSGCCGNVKCAVFRTAPTVSCESGGDQRSTEHVCDMVCEFTVEDAVIKFDIVYSVPQNDAIYHK
jgi:hypothetical protein